MEFERKDGKKFFKTHPNNTPKGVTFVNDVGVIFMVVMDKNGDLAFSVIYSARSSHGEGELIYVPQLVRAIKLKLVEV